MEKENLFMNGATASWNAPTDQLNCYFNPNWENSMDQSDPFESALSSIVSSPVAVASSNGEPVMIKELIGRLGTICNSREISPSHSSYINNNCNSRHGSCYSTPLNSPPKITENHVSILANPSVLPQFAGDPGFVERAARFSCFGGGLNAQFRLNESELVMPKISGGDGREESSVSEQIPGGELSIKSKRNDSNGRKRKGIPRGKAKEAHFEDKKVSEESNAKRSKSEEEEAKENEKQKKKEEEEEEGHNGDEKQKKAAAEPPKDYIHVRARRGQATDSHSLAERVRREKISERMKFLQDLVPGCNKVIGKAVMLDEIINYVQSLQRQVEFLSMKLATVNPRMEALVSNSKDIFQLPNALCPPLMEMEPYTCQPISITPSNPLLGFPNSAASPQVAALWEDDLQSVVQMGFGQNQQQSCFHGRMKIES